MSIHERAATGFARAGSDYERGRPGYPPAAVAWLAAALGLGPGVRVLDLAAGTGKLTRMLADTGARVVAVEPVDDMRARITGCPALPGTAEAIPLPDGGVRAVTVAQALHWFATERALTEIRRVLCPGGRLGLVWNAWDESEGWVRELTAIVHPHGEGVPAYRHSSWRAVVEAFPGFGPVHGARFAHRPESDAAGLVARVASISYVAALPERARGQVLEQIGALAREHPALRGRARFAVPYRTDAFWCERRERPDAGRGR